MLKSGKLLLEFWNKRWKNGMLERSRWNIIPFPRDMWKNGMSDKWKARRLKLKVKEF